MQIFVGQTAYQVEASTSIDTLKAMIENKEFVPAQFIRLVNGANTIEGGTLAGNGIEEDDSISMVYDALAGMRAKWRKSKFFLFHGTETDIFCLIRSLTLCLPCFLNYFRENAPSQTQAS